jgi:hypothetical protein
MANVRELLRAVMPLMSLTPLQVIELDGRARSRKSRLKNHDVEKSGMRHCQGINKIRRMLI